MSGYRRQGNSADERLIQALAYARKMHERFSDPGKNPHCYREYKILMEVVDTAFSFLGGYLLGSPSMTPGKIPLFMLNAAIASGTPLVAEKDPECRRLRYIKDAFIAGAGFTLWNMDKGEWAWFMGCCIGAGSLYSRLSERRKANDSE